MYFCIYQSVYVFFKIITYSALAIDMFIQI